MTKGAIGNLANRYRAVLKEFASLAIAGVLIMVDWSTTLAVDLNYIIDTDTHWNDYLYQNYQNRARVLHGGDTLTINNNATVTFDFANPSSATEFGNGGTIIYSMDYINGQPLSGDVNVSGGAIISKSTTQKKGYAILASPGYPATITLNNTNLQLEDFAYGIYGGSGEINIINKKTIFNNTYYSVFTSNNTKVDIQSDSFSSIGYIPIRAQGKSSVNIHDGDTVKLDFSHSGIYTEETASVFMKNSDITMTGPFGFNARGDSSVAMEADNVHLTTDSIVYGDNNAHVNLLVKKSGTIQGNVIANGSSNISIGLYGNSKWSGASVKNDSAFVQVSLEDEAAWYVKNYSITPTQDQSSVISHLQVKGGIIDLASSQKYQQLSIDKLTGNGGTFHVKTDIQADSTDQIVIGNGTGTHQLQVQATGAEPNREAMDSFIVQQHTGNASFSLANAGGKVEHGLYFYELADRKGDGGQEWYLKRVVPIDPDGKPETPTGQAEAALSGLAGHYALWYGQQTDLRKRLGEIRYGAQTGLWARGFADRARLDGFAGTSFTQNTYGGSLGYDKLVSGDETYMWMLGMQLRGARADQHVNGHWGGHGDLTSIGGGLYSTWAHTDGWYVDAVGTIDWYTHKIRATMLDGTRVHDDRSSYGLGASLEAGRKFDFGYSNDNRDYWFVEPQLQLSYFWIKGGDFTASNGMKIDQEDMDSLTGRAGVVLGKKFSLGSDPNDSRYVQPYIKAGVNHEFLGEQVVHINNTRMDSDLAGTRVYYGAGIDWQATDSLRVYAQVEREHGEHFTREINVSAGLKWEF